MKKIKYTAIDFKGLERLSISSSLIDFFGQYNLDFFIISYFCNTIEYQNYYIISPASYDKIWEIETPIIIQGNIDRTTVISIFDKTWKIITRTCRFWIEDHIQEEYRWRKAWRLWENHAWSVVVVHAESLNTLYEKLAIAWREYRWIGINWQGESSSLSGVNAIVWSGMDRNLMPRDMESQFNLENIDLFYRKINYKLGQELIEKGEYLNITQLVQRLLTCKEIAKKINQKLSLSSTLYNSPIIRILNPTDYQFETGWFQGSGDKISEHIRKISIQSQNEAEELQTFSRAMSQWMKQSLQPSLSEILGKIVYAKRDKFLSIFDYSSQLNLSSYECLEWLYEFNSKRKSSIWNQHGQPITISGSFIWAAAGLFQQDVLRHCQEGQQSAQQQGGDRLAVRVLFKSGNYLEWICPWWFLQPVLEGYRDRNDRKNWNHIYNDVAQLEHRFAFSGEDSEVALGLFQIYFGLGNRTLLENHLWDTEGKTGILGNDRQDCSNPHQALNNWIRKLGKIGFYLCR